METIKLANNTFILLGYEKGGIELVEYISTN